MDHASDLIDIGTAAALAGRNPETVRRWVRSGRLAALRRGNRLLVGAEDVEALAGHNRLTLTAWADQMRRVVHAHSPSVHEAVSAADLVLDDRARRS